MRQSRPLTPAETALAASVFGDAIDCASVEVRNRKWIFFQPRRTTMAPLGHIHFHPGGGLYREDFGQAPLDAQGLFIHEMAHVWQHQKGIFLPLARHPFCAIPTRSRPAARSRATASSSRPRSSATPSCCATAAKCPAPRPSPTMSGCCASS